MQGTKGQCLSVAMQPQISLIHFTYKITALSTICSYTNKDNNYIKLPTSNHCASNRISMSTLHLLISYCPVQIIHLSPFVVSYSVTSKSCNAKISFFAMESNYYVYFSVNQLFLSVAIKSCSLFAFSLWCGEGGCKSTKKTRD